MKYSELVEVYEKLDSTSKRLEKTYYISQALKKANNDLGMIMLLIQGKVFPEGEKDKKLGFSDSYVIKAIQRVTGSSEKEVKNLWSKKGDLGDVAEQLCEGKKQQTLFARELSVKKVFENIRKLPEIEGSGTVDRKVQLVSELLSSASSKEAKYIARTVLEVLRLGTGTGTIRDAIVWAYFGDSLGVKYNPGDNDFSMNDREKYNEVVDIVQSAYDKLNDFVKVAELASKSLDELKKVEIKIGNPLKVMLAPVADTMEDGFERVGTPAAIEYKYDGFRVQIHKKKDIKVYTRRLEDVTNQFPDIVEVVKEIKGNFIIDGEAMGYDPKNKKYLPFQKISQRIKRKYKIDEMIKELPVEINVFDILYYEGKSCLGMSFEERRKLIEKIISVNEFSIRPSHCLITSDIKEATKFYDQAKKEGMEGVMLKNVKSPYKPGSRVGNWVKLKPTMETLDLVIVGAEWGEGKRSGWLTSFTLACYQDGDFLTVGKVGTGIKELEEQGMSFKELTEMLKPNIGKEEGRSVEIHPSIVVEIRFNEIQKSTTYTSGYALRFPRLAVVRADKDIDDASPLEYVEQLFRGQ